MEDEIKGDKERKRQIKKKFTLPSPLPLRLAQSGDHSWSGPDFAG